MRLIVIWRTSIKAIFKNMRRSILTMLGIIIGIAAVITIVSLGLGFQEETIKNLTNGKEGEIVFEVDYVPDDPNLYTSNVDFFYTSDLEIIEEIEGVKEVSFPMDENELISMEVDVMGLPVPKQVSLINGSGTDVVAGRAITEQDNEIHNKVVVIDSNLANDLYGSPEQAIGNGVEIDGQIFTIVGVMQSPTEYDIYTGKPNIELPKKTYYDYFAIDDLTYAIRISILPNYDPQAVAEDCLQALEESGAMRDQGEYFIFDTSVLTDTVSKQLKSLTYFLASIASISLFIAGVGIMNMMYISVSERTKEIGIRRALGASGNSIRMQFLLEGVTITMIGGIIGYILGISFAKLFTLILPFPVSVDLLTVSIALGASLIIGIVFSVVPASNAAKKDLIDILK